MKRRSIAAILMSLAIAALLVPATAFAATVEEASQLAVPLTTQAGKNLAKCTIKFTDDAHVCADNALWQMYFVKGKAKTAEPEFDLYYGKKKVPKSAYTVKYRLTWWDDKAEKERFKTVKASALKPSASPYADSTDMSSEYRLVITAKSDSGYTGSYEEAAVIAVDWYNVGRNMDKYLTKAKEKWHFAINPMNHSYFVIPQASAKTVLNSLVLRAGCSPGDGEMHHDGTKIAKKHYTVSYYKAKRTAVEQNMSPASSAKTGKKLSAMPVTAGSYVMVIKGKKPYYGTASILFDIQDKAASLSVAKIQTQTYTGEAVEPVPTVKYKGTTLKLGRDYTVSYRNNVEKGTATIVIKGVNKIKTNSNGAIVEKSADRFFAGSKTVTFKIA